MHDSIDLMSFQLAGESEKLRSRLGGQAVLRRLAAPRALHYETEDQLHKNTGKECFMLEHGLSGASDTAAWEPASAAQKISAGRKPLRANESGFTKSASLRSIAGMPLTGL